MNRKGHANASIAVACYYIGRANVSIPLPIAKRTAQAEGWTANDATWIAALDIVNSRAEFSDPAQES